jgi:hypothetical protein
MFFSFGLTNFSFPIWPPHLVKPGSAPGEGDGVLADEEREKSKEVRKTGN